MNTFRLIFAIVLVSAFGVFAIFLVSNADTTDNTEWERWVYVFGGVQAPAFAALGWLFGREVNRERAAVAEQRAQNAESEKEDALQKSAKLAGLVVGEQSRSTDRPKEALGQAYRSSSESPAVAFARREFNL